MILNQFSYQLDFEDLESERYDGEEWKDLESFENVEGTYKNRLRDGIIRW